MNAVNQRSVNQGVDVRNFQSDTSSVEFLLRQSVGLHKALRLEMTQRV